VRPFLTSASEEGPRFALEILADTIVAGGFVDGREPRGEYEAKSVLKLRAGTYVLRTELGSYEETLVDEVLVGPTRARGEPTGPGRFRVTTISGGTGLVTYRFTHEAGFRLPSGEGFRIEMGPLEFHARDGVPVSAARVLAEDFLVQGFVCTGTPEDDARHIARYTSMAYPSLPLWEGRMELESGDEIRFLERYQVPDGGSGPAGLEHAEVRIGSETRAVDGYWSLVYSAQHHNVDVRYWAILDPPVLVPQVGTVHVAAWDAPGIDGSLPSAYWLGSDFAVLREPRVTCYLKALEGQLGSCGFRRGDVDSSGKVNLTDAVFLLDHLFRGGAALLCPDSGDFDDDRTVGLTDAVLILTFLFRGADLSAPPGPYECGPDPIGADPDTLPACGAGACP
jgi:hypothetical protein